MEKVKRKVMGHKSGAYKSPTYRSWENMRYRCKHPYVNSYARYGGRGIQVCERWNTFANFLEDMGVRPEGTSIDRINPNGNYEPNNCRWANAKTQARNKGG